MNLFLYEKHVVEHCHDLQREAEQERMLASLQHSRQSVLRHAVGRLGALLVTLGSRLEGVEQYREQVGCNV